MEQYVLAGIGVLVTALGFWIATFVRDTKREHEVLHKRISSVKESSIQREEFVATVKALQGGVNDLKDALNRHTEKLDTLILRLTNDR